MYVRPIEDVFDYVLMSLQRIIAEMMDSGVTSNSAPPPQLWGAESVMGPDVLTVDTE